MNENFPLLSIIIVSLNRKKDLLNCLKSIFSQIYKHYEILLIDNGSSDGSAEAVEEKFPEVRIFKTNKNLGTSYTRNAGVNFSKGDLIWFLDSDVYLEDIYTLKNLIQLFIDDQEIDGIGGEAKINNNGKIIGTKKLKLHANGLTKGYFYENGENKKISVKVIPTCNLLIKKEAIKEVGGFDHFYFFYLEDMDLTYRISQRGFKLIVYHKCPVVHHFSESLRFSNHFKSKRNRIYFLLKNQGLISIIFLPFNDLLYLVNLDNLKRIYKKFFQSQRIYKHLVTENKKKITIKNVFDTFKTTSIITLSILTSYIYIPIFLFKYNFKLRKKINFLNLIKQENFTFLNKKVTK